MALLRGKLLAGALFAGALFGVAQDDVAQAQTVYGSTAIQRPVRENYLDRIRADDNEVITILTAMLGVLP